MKPPPGEYHLPGGVFLLIGYSSTDESLLRPHTNLGVQDAVRALQRYIINTINNRTLCTLTLFNISDENIILSARLPHDSKMEATEVIRKEKVYQSSYTLMILFKIIHTHRVFYYFPQLIIYSHR